MQRKIIKGTKLNNDIPLYKKGGKHYFKLLKKERDTRMILYESVD